CTIIGHVYDQERAKAIDRPKHRSTAEVAACGLLQDHAPYQKLGGSGQLAGQRPILGSGWRVPSGSSVNRNLSLGVAAGTWTARKSPLAEGAQRAQDMRKNLAAASGARTAFPLRTYPLDSGPFPSDACRDGQRVRAEGIDRAGAEIGERTVGGGEIDVASLS